MNLLNNSYVYWIITGSVSGLLSLVIVLMRKRMADQEKDIAQVKNDCRQNENKINEITANLPIQYTLRDEFLRVTTDQNRKLDKIGDAISELSQSMAAIRTAVTRGDSNGN